MANNFWKQLSDSLKTGLDQASQWAEDLGSVNGFEANASLGDLKRVLSRKNRGTNFGVDLKLDYNKEMSGGNIITGKSGSGKSSIMTLSALISAPPPRINEHDEPGFSYIVISSTGDDFNRTVGNFADIGYSWHMLDPSNAQRSNCSINLLKGVSYDQVLQVSREIDFAVNGKNSSDPHWRNGGIAYISMHMKKEILLKEDPCMADVEASIKRSIAQPDEFKVEMSQPLIPQELFMEFKGHLNDNPKARASIESVAKTTLSQFSDFHVQRVTGNLNHFNILSMRKTSKVLYLGLPMSKYENFSSVNTLIFSKILEELMSQPFDKEQDNTIVIFIDELGEMRGLKPHLIPQAVAQLRKFGSYLNLGFQHYNQMVELFGKELAEVIATNVYSTVFLPPFDLATARQLSQRIGRTTSVNKDTGHKIEHDLFSVDDLMYGSSAFLFSANERPIQLRKRHLRPYYKSPYHLERSQLPIPHMTSLIDLENQRQYEQEEKRVNEEMKRNSKLQRHDVPKPTEILIEDDLQNEIYNKD